MPRSRSDGSREIPARFRAIGWRTAVLVLAGALVYLNSLSQPFVFDDDGSVVNNSQIRHLTDVHALLVPMRERPVAGRPLANISFALNYAAGGLNVIGYHAVNIVLHLLCALVLFALVRRTLEQSSVPSTLRTRAADVSFATALLWMLHPLNTEVVDYITQRTESMMALCYLSTLYASLRAAGSRDQGRWQSLAVLACGLGMACKESMVTAPLMVVLFDRVFLFDSLRRAWHARRRLYVGLATTWIVLAALLSTGPRIHSAGFSSGFSPWTYLLNQPPILLRYLTLTVWPRSLVLLYGWPEAVTLESVWPSALFIVSLLVLTVVTFRSRPQLALLGAWVWITLAPTSSIVPIATEVAAERRMYLPLAALILLAVIAFTWTWTRWTARTARTSRFGRMIPLVPSSVLVLVAAVLGAGTILRNQDYVSALSLAEGSLDRYATPVGHHVLGAELLKVGRRDEAFVQLRQALPGAPRAHFTLGEALLETGDTSEGLRELRAFVNEQPSYLADVTTAHELLGKAFAGQGRWTDAINEFGAILQTLPNDPTAELYTGDALFAEGRVNESIPYYQAYLSSGARNPSAWNSLGIALGSSGRLTEAAAAFRAALQVDASNGPAERNLASALSALGDWDGSLTHAERAVAIQPNDAGSHDVLGRALAVKGRLDEAMAHFVRAVALDPDLVDARQDLQRIEESLRPERRQ